MAFTVSAGDLRVFAVEKDGTWNIRCVDVPTGKECKLNGLTHVQAAALVALCIGGEEFTPSVTKELYAICEHLLADCPVECRMIP